MHEIPSKYNARLLSRTMDAGLQAALGQRFRPFELPDRCILKLEQLDSAAAALIEKLPGALLRSSVGTADGSAKGSAAGGSNGEAFLIGSPADLLELAAGLRRQPGLAALAEEVETCVQPPNRMISWAGRTLDFNRKTYVMGILNCTTDSFYPDSRLAGQEIALERAQEMIEQGVDILDIGGESTRPDSESVAAEEQIRRVVPVIEGIRRSSGIMISIDTGKRTVAAAALDAGADLVNDITALRGDQGLPPLLAERQVPVVLMHIRGTPKNMQQKPMYRDTIGEIIRELRCSIHLADEAGIRRDMLIVDPGIGFGKRVEDNLRIVRQLRLFESLGAPILIGLSRKSFIGAVIDAPVDKRLIGTVTANTIAVLHGAGIVRVHDPAEALEMVRMIAAVTQGAEFGLAFE